GSALEAVFGRRSGWCAAACCRRLVLAGRRLVAQLPVQCWLAWTRPMGTGGTARGARFIPGRGRCIAGVIAIDRPAPLGRADGRMTRTMRLAGLRAGVWKRATLPSRRRLAGYERHAGFGGGVTTAGTPSARRVAWSPAG